ncbi:MAG: ArsR family transcriptional regulator [Nanoarchaeota archaeon]|nr:ArsR family transcriptional regulator [Nanoarchaeota archaeon]MBU1030159.1 ArsR family transcriptional regulator [Nanoarchaeota archaeon]MBU1849398.1 ArsR family transcriptional regulator [Nanoarchaeota archaeon]
MKNLKEKSLFFKALSHPIRIKIIEYLLKKDDCNCICHISKKIKKDQSVAFRHIQILKAADIITTCKQDKFLACKIKNKERIRKLLHI